MNHGEGLPVWLVFAPSLASRLRGALWFHGDRLLANRRRELLSKLLHACHLLFPSLGQKQSPYLWDTNCQGDAEAYRAAPELNLALMESAQPRPGGGRGQGPAAVSDACFEDSF